MIDPARVYAVTLAAGLGSRFGGDKLSAPLGEDSVLNASLKALDGFGWMERAVVASPGLAVRDGMSCLLNDAPENGMGHSLAIAARAALAADADFLLVTLGDMPLLSHDSIARLLNACPDMPHALAAMQADGAKPGPPAMFGRGWLGVLTTAGGDSGARNVLRNPANKVAIVSLAADENVDIDTKQDLAAIAQCLPKLPKGL